VPVKNVKQRLLRQNANQESQENPEDQEKLDDKLRFIANYATFFRRKNMRPATK